jgi:hypothetical protein
MAMLAGKPPLQSIAIAGKHVNMVKGNCGRRVVLKQ